MIKVVRDGFIFYYKDNLAETIINRLVNEGNDRSGFFLIQMASFIIDVKKNEFVKCRYTLEDLVDNLVK